MPGLFSSSPKTNQAERIDDIFSWWQAAKHPTIIGRFFPSYQTILLDKSLKEFSALLVSKKNTLNKKKLAALELLRAQVLDWQHMHIVNKQSSHRGEVIRNLLERINTEAMLIKKALATQLPGSKTTVESHAVNNISSSPTAPRQESLFSWWEENSRLGWLNRRSEATKELDKAIFWYSNSIIICEKDALEQILNAIEVWLYARKELSIRTPIVLNLKKKIENEIASLPLIKDNSDEEHNYSLMHG